LPYGGALGRKGEKKHAELQKGRKGGGNQGNSAKPEKLKRPAKEGPRCGRRAQDIQSGTKRLPYRGKGQLTPNKEVRTRKIGAKKKGVHGETKRDWTT